MGARGVGDGDHRAVSGCESRHGGRNTVLTIRAVCAVAAGRTLRALLAIMHYKRMGARGVGDGDHRAVSGCESRHGGRNTVRTSGTLLAVVQQIALGVAVRHRQNQHIAGVGRCHRKSRHIAGATCVQCVRHTQQLLNTLNAIVGTARRINFRLQVERALSPRNLGEVLAGVSATHLHGQQAVDVGGGKVRLRINGRTRGTALEDGYPYRDILIGYQNVVATANHRLI